MREQNFCIISKQSFLKELKYIKVYVHRFHLKFTNIWTTFIRTKECVRQESPQKWFFFTL